MNSDVEFRHLRALVAVAREGGVSRAARALAVSQSTVSEHLLALERALGVKLTVRRRGRELTLSEAGVGWLPHAARILREVEVALAAAGVRRVATLRVGASESLGSFVLPPVLSELQDRWPHLEIQVSNGLCEGLREGVRADIYDLALTLVADDGDARGREGLMAARLASAQVALLARPDDALASKAGIDRVDLAGRMVLTPDAEGEFQRRLESYLRGVSRVSLRSAGSIGGVVAGISVSGALGVLPGYAVAAEIQRGELIELSVQGGLPDFAIEAAVLPGESSPPLKEFIALLCEQLAAGAEPPTLQHPDDTDLRRR